MARSLHRYPRPAPAEDPYEADDPVIGMSAAGVLEWGLPFFRGVAALQGLEGALVDDDTVESAMGPGEVPDPIACAVPAS